jgi:hypothetical protein
MRPLCTFAILIAVTIVSGNAWAKDNESDYEPNPPTLTTLTTLTTQTFPKDIDKGIVIVDMYRAITRVKDIATNGGRFQNALKTQIQDDLANTTFSTVAWYLKQHKTKTVVLKGAYGKKVIGEFQQAMKEFQKQDIDIKVIAYHKLSAVSTQDHYSKMANATAELLRLGANGVILMPTKSFREGTTSGPEVYLKALNGKLSNLSPQIGYSPEFSYGNNAGQTTLTVVDRLFIADSRTTYVAPRVFWGAKRASEGNVNQATALLENNIKISNNPKSIVPFFQAGGHSLNNKNNSYFRKARTNFNNDPERGPGKKRNDESGTSVIWTFEELTIGELNYF